MTQSNKLFLPYQHPSIYIMGACEKGETSDSLVCGYFFLKKTSNISLNPFYTLSNHLALKQVAILMLVAVAVKICKL